MQRPARSVLTLVGAGSAMFCRGIVGALIRDGRPWELRLVDVSSEPLDVARRLAERLVDAHEADVSVRASEDRAELLPGTDLVVVSIGVGGRRAWEQDVLVPRRFGIFQPVGDTAMPGGVSRALRQVPAMVAIARDVEALCPDAVFVDVANPMAPICRAITRETRVTAVGLCHGVRSTEEYLARLVEVPHTEIAFQAAGVNHLTWIVRMERDGEDLFGRLRHALVADPAPRETDPLSWSLFDRFGMVPAPMDRHVVEFHPEHAGEGGYFGRTLGVDVFGFEETVSWGEGIYARMRAEALGEHALDPDLGGGEPDEAVRLAHARWGGEPLRTSVNVPDHGQLPQLPAGAIVESTALVAADGVHPDVFDPFPPEVLEVLRRQTEVQELAVEAALRGDRNAFVEALLVDGSVPDRATAGRLADALLDAQAAYLPAFSGA